MIRRLALPVAAVALGVLLGLLAILQYRWLGQVSDGERQRMRATLEARARDFAADFDAELTRATAAFLVGPGDLTPRLAQGWERWMATASSPRLVRGVFAVDRSTPQLSLRQYDPAIRQLVAADWPLPFRQARDRWAAGFKDDSGSKSPTSTVPHLATRVFIDDLSDVPALVVPTQPDVIRIATGNATTTTPPPAAAGQGPSAGSAPPSPFPILPMTIQSRMDVRLPAGTSAAAADVVLRQTTRDTIVLWLDLDEIQRTLLPSLARKYFTSDDVFDYQVKVVLRRDPGRVLFETSGSSGASTRRPADNGDATVPMFRVRLAEVFDRASEPAAHAAAPAASASNASRPAPQSGDRYAVSVMRLDTARQFPARGGAVFAVSDGSGGWLLRLVHRAGSLDAAVERLRRRNLAISSTVLGLLAMSLAFVLVSTRRAQRLAAQQVEFVASVSHELRTPLAVIRSAGENLADGVVESPDHVRRYGALVAEEGRKLGAMVEQVMEYAGMQSDQPRWQMATVDLAEVIDDAVAGARRLPEAREASIDVQVDAGLPPIDGDRAALVRAVQNLVENAVKYGKAEGGTWVGVRASACEANVAIDVSDRGPGIDAAERRRIFEPFVRGRAAASAHVAGNGLGLSIVRRVAEGHGGHVEVAGNAPTGARFTITLPRCDRAGNAERRSQNDERR